MDRILPGWHQQFIG